MNSSSTYRLRGRPARHEESVRAALVKARLALLLNSGYSATTVEAVAKRARINKTPHTFM